MQKNTKENRTFRILSALGIIFVVSGHLGYSAFEVGGLFPYYSFHVFVFLFVSGYFYKEEAENSILNYIGRKCKTLLLPYFLWNLFYGAAATLLHGLGFSLGKNLSLKTLLIQPFVDGHQFLYNFSAWFVPALFLLEVLNVLMRKILGILHLKNEWLILAGCLILGMLAVQLAIEGRVWGYYKLPGRLMFMMPGFQMGRIYREKLERHDTLPDGWYFLIVTILQSLISIFCAGLAFSTVWVGSFANGPMVPYLTIVTGIAFWLRIAKMIDGLPVLAEKMAFLGRNTYAVMLHHVAIFMVIKGICYLCSCFTPLCADFNPELFFHDIGYVYPMGGAEGSKLIYLVAGIGVPLAIKKWGTERKRKCAI